jgi:hypothetical protein
MLSYRWFHPPPIAASGGGRPYHITQRGNNRQEIFLLDEDLEIGTGRAVTVTCETCAISVIPIEANRFF